MRFATAIRRTFVRSFSPLRRRLVLLPAFALVLLFVPAGASADLSPTGDARALAEAIADHPAFVRNALFQTGPPAAVSHGVANVPVAGFPTHGPAFTIMTTGSVKDALKPSNFIADQANGGANVRGSSDFDVTILTIDLRVPDGADCLFFDFRFATDETGDRVLAGRHDAFVAEVDASTWTTDDAGLNAPDNFAFESSGRQISLDQIWTQMTPEEAAGTVYGRATPLLRAWAPVEADASVLYLSIFDQGDDKYDSAVLLDHVSFGRSFGQDCKPGVTLVATKTASSPTVGAGDKVEYTITVTPVGDEQAFETPPTVGSVGDTLPLGFSYVPGSTSGSTTSDPVISGATHEWFDEFEPALPEAEPVTIRFAAIVSEKPGVYFNQVGAHLIRVGAQSMANAFSLDSGPTAPVTVVSRPADLALTQRQDPDAAVVGQEVTYFLTIANNGPGPATNVEANVTLPPGTVVATQPSQGACSPIAAVAFGMAPPLAFVTCALGSLAVGDSATVAVVWAATKPGSFTATATVTGAEDDPDATNNSQALKTVVAPDLLALPDVATLPVLGEVVGITPAAGEVLVRTPGGDRFVPLEEVGSLPTGSRVDARLGRVELTSVDPDGAIQTGEFRGSVFLVSQKKNGRVVLTLKSGDFSVCTSGAKKLAGDTGPTTRRTQRFVKRFGGRVVRKLWGRTKARAKFRTRGRYSAATVRGTAWITIDRCGGTEIRVKKGRVAVWDVARKRTRLVKAGQSYLVKRPTG